MMASPFLSVADPILQQQVTTIKAPAHHSRVEGYDQYNERKAPRRSLPKMGWQTIDKDDVTNRRCGCYDVTFEFRDFHLVRATVI